MLSIIVIAFSSTIAGMGFGLSLGFVFGRADAISTFLIDHKKDMRNKVQ